MQAFENQERRLFIEISRGYSEILFKNNVFFIKHLSNEDYLDIENEAKRRASIEKTEGLPTEMEEVSFLIATGSWQEEKEKQIKEIKSNIEDFENTLSAVSGQFLIQCKENIRNEKERLERIEEEKNSLMGMTVESFYEREFNSLFFQKSIFQDKLFFTPLVYDDVYFEDYSDLVQAYNSISSHINENVIKKLSISSFFRVYWSYIEDPKSFFNRNVYELTVFQSKLLFYAKIFKSIFENFDVPEHLRDDADSVLSWHESESRKRKMESQKKSHSAPKPQSRGGPQKIQYGDNMPLGSMLDF